MRETHSVTTSPSIAVVQGAYESFCFATENAETECFTGAIVYRLYNFEQAKSIIDDRAGDWLTFQRLVHEWQAERGATSSITEAALCPAYQNIIGMGELVVPLILDQLQAEGDEPDQWFWALSAITRANPVRDADRGDYVKMAKAWLEWGKNEGYAW